MKVVTARGEVGADGRLVLELETALPAGPVEVVLVIQSAEPPGGPVVFSATALKEPREPGEPDESEALEEVDWPWRQNVEKLERRAPGEWGEGWSGKWGHC